MRYQSFQIDRFRKMAAEVLKGPVTVMIDDEGMRAWLQSDPSTHILENPNE